MSRSRGIFYESLQRDFWRFQKFHSPGPSFFFLPRESEKITPQRDFLHFPSGALMAIKADISSRGIFHIHPLELSWQQPIFPPEGFFTLHSGGLNVLVN